MRWETGLERISFKTMAVRMLRLLCNMAASCLDAAFELLSLDLIGGSGQSSTWSGLIGTCSLGGVGCGTGASCRDFLRLRSDSIFTFTGSAFHFVGTDGCPGVIAALFAAAFFFSIMPAIIDQTTLKMIIMVMPFIDVSICD